MSEEVMGKDIRITDNDVQFSNNQDFSVIAGYNNLQQAIYTRLSTIKGEYYNEFYGSELNKTYGEPMNDTLKNQIIGYVNEALIQEPRIQSIENVEVDFIIKNDKRVALINMTVIPIESTTPINLIYPQFITEA